MANRKTRRQRKPKKPPRSKDILKSQLLRSLAGISVLILLIVLAGVATHYLLLKKHLIGPKAKPAETQKPQFEIYPEHESLPVAPPPKPKPGVAKELPKIAIIIDDVGYDPDIIEKFLGLDAALTFSVLPQNPFQRSIAKAAQAKGVDLMLHLPMEPNEYPLINPGPGALLTSMSPDELIYQLKLNLDAVPLIKGVNNHMGSKMTAVSTQMYQIFSILKKRNLFFIDSRTTVDTLCMPSARLFKVPFAQRDVFIDHIQEADFIRKQLHRLLHIAETRGEAIGIAHPHELTYNMLLEILPELKQRSILVPASQLVHIIG